MRRSPAAAISDAVLYEGYLLYPYRDSAIKNQYRWTFGCLFPKTWCELHEPSDRNHLRAEFLINVSHRAEIDTRLRCLVLPSTDSGDKERAPVEREVFVRGSELCEGIDGQYVEAFTLSTGPDAQTCKTSDSGEIQGELKLVWTHVGTNVFRVSISVRNETVHDATTIKTRDDASRFALLSTQLTLCCREAEFISITDPPSKLQGAATECRNDGCWPVLTGLPGKRDQLLIAPIILSDYPQVAPESSGDFFDGTEIDEMLTMRIRTLTEREKAQMAQSDPRADELLRRTEATPDDQLSQMHGLMRETQNLSSLMDDTVPNSVRVDGIDLRPGDQVRLRPQQERGQNLNDIFDLALDGRTATIETIERDFGDQLYFTVTADCDPGRDFGQMGLPGHRFFFRPNEVQPLSRERSEES